MRVLFFSVDFSQNIAPIFHELGHQIRIAKRESWKQTLTALRDLLWCDTVYLIYGRDLNSVKLLRLAMALKKRMIIHWIGTDVLQATEKFQKDHIVLNSQYPHIDLADADHLRKELENIGIHAAFAPIVAFDLNYPVQPAPEKHMVLSYIPETREQFYGIEILKELAKRHPEVPFCIVANDGKNDPNKLPNIHYMGRVGRQEMAELYGKCSVLFRYPEHDGMPVMVLEAMGLGRQVIHRYPFAHVITPENDSIEAIDAALQKVLSEPPKVNQEGADYVKREFTKEKISEWYQRAGVI